MWCGIVSVLLGVAGWFVTSFFAKPLLDFWNLRSQVQEEVIFTANVAPIAAHDPRYRKTADSLRRLGAKVLAMNITESRPLRRYLSKCKYDLGKAGRGLINLSGTLAANSDPARADSERELRIRYTSEIQLGLKLPRE
jgi:hypothetical protein